MNRNKYSTDRKGLMGLDLAISRRKLKTYGKGATSWKLAAALSSFGVKTHFVRNSGI